MHEQQIQQQYFDQHFDVDLLHKASGKAGALPALIEKQEPQQGKIISMTVFLMLVVAFLLPGLVGHDPWKQDETYIFGIVQHLLDSGDWVVPTLAGEPFMEKPPLYYWTAAASAWLFSPWLPAHDGARLATGLFMAVTCGSLGWTARHWWGQGFGRLSVLAMLGCLGIVFYGHLMLTDIPLLTGFALASCGFALSRSRAFAGGLLLGLGVGVGFLAKGVLAPGVLGITGILLPVCFRNWRSQIYCRTLVIALLAASPALLIWPAALYLRSPALFMEWFWLNNIGRFVGFSVPMLGAPHSGWFWSETLPWFSFPALPLALITLWRRRNVMLTSEPIQFSVTLFGVLMSVLWLSASARPNYALPLLAPLSLLAGPAIVGLPQSVDRWWDWSARTLFGSFAAVICGVYLWMLVRGSLPADWALVGRYLPLDFRPRLNLGAVTVSCLIVLLAGAAAVRQPKTHGRGMISWMIGMTFCWALLSMLWLDWIDAAKSYRTVFASLQSALPYPHGCIASSGLGESERAMLSYFLGINTKRHEVTPDADCNLFLIEGLATLPPREVNSSLWKLVWDGARSADQREHFWLFKAGDPSSSIAGAR